VNLAWQIGRVRVTRILDLVWKIDPTNLIPDATPEALGRHAWLRPHFVLDDGRVPLSIHAFVVESEGARILVDTCIGNDKARPVRSWDQRQGSFLDDLEAAGFAPDSIDRVLCTHLHVDHVGWNTRLDGDRWVPTFPSARYLIGRKEWGYWSEEDDDLARAVLADSVRPILDAGLVDLVDSDLELTSEVRLLSTPGHTPGHVSVAIESDGAKAVITGDLLHHPVQCAHPQWLDSFDVDRPQAERTRLDFLKSCADEGTLVLATHFAAPTSGLIIPDGDAWRFEAG
jgi:glyoxylase-like metal-dependent hydrolase (beta-lactamase superfamily II)